MTRRLRCAVERRGARARAPGGSPPAAPDSGHATALTAGCPRFRGLNPDGRGSMSAGDARLAGSVDCTDDVPPPRSTVNGTGTSPSLGRPTPGVVKQDKSSGGSVDTTKTRSGPQRVRMSSGERPIGTAKGKQSDTEALCQPLPPPSPRWAPNP